MTVFPSRMIRSLALLLCVFFTGTAFGEEGERKGRGKPDKQIEGRRDTGDSARREAWESLSEEQREKLKSALRDVWTDPAVISAREEVKQASDAYQDAIKVAVSRSDPSLAEAMTKIQRSHSGMAHERIWGGPGRGGRDSGKGVPQTSSRRGAPGEKGGTKSRRGFGDQIRPPGYMDALSKEEQEQFRRAEEAALASEAVQTARSELEKIREEGEALRRRRLDAHRNLRKVTVDEMMRIDPAIAGIRKKLSGDDRKTEPAPRREVGKKDDLRPSREKSGSGEVGADDVPRPE